MSNQCKPSCTPAPSQGRGTMPSKQNSLVLHPATEGDYSIVYPFSEEEYRKGVATLKNNKASGRDDVLVEQLNSWSQIPQIAADNAKQMLHGT